MIKAEQLEKHYSALENLCKTNRAYVGSLKSISDVLNGFSTQEKTTLKRLGISSKAHEIALHRAYMIDPEFKEQFSSIMFEICKIEYKENND